MSAPILNDIANQVCEQHKLSLDGFLGRGAFKQSFRAKSLTGADVAVKIAQTSEALQPRLSRETQALGECKHPSIASLHESFAYASGGAKYWVTIEEYIPAGTLEQRLVTGCLAPSDVRALLVPLAGALGHLHEKQLVHRDIKPANILFRTSGEPVLTDFGLVRMLDQSSLTQDFLGMGPGTPLYAAPEQLLNEKAEIDWRTDQFALALVACRCLFDMHPFAPTGTQMEAVQNVLERQRISDTAGTRLDEVGFSSLKRALEPWSVSRFRWPDQFMRAIAEEGEK